MAALFDLIAMTVSSAPGTSATLPLGSAATINGVTYLSFSGAGTPAGKTISYSILDTGASEIGTAVYTSSNTTLTSRTPTKSTNSNAAIAASSAAIILCGPRAEDIISTDLANTFTTTQKQQAQANIFVGQTFQSLTSGSSATYTAPTGVTWIEVFFVGGGGGGGGVTATPANSVAGSDGTKTTFNNVDAAPGKGAGASGGITVNAAGGAGGTGGAGGGVSRMPGSPGTSGCNSAVATTGPSAGGGSSVLFGGAGAPLGFATAVGNAGATNTGGGGGGAVNVTTNNNFGAGGGGGECVYLFLFPVAATYTYTIGAGGAGGASTTNGGAGGSGFIFVVEHYGS